MGREKGWSWEKEEILLIKKMLEKKYSLPDMRAEIFKQFGRDRSEKAIKAMIVRHRMRDTIPRVPHPKRGRPATRAVQEEPYRASDDNKGLLLQSITNVIAANGMARVINGTWNVKRPDGGWQPVNFKDIAKLANRILLANELKPIELPEMWR